MSAIHHEIQFETYIVEKLLAQGWLEGEHNKHDRARALYPEDVIGWIKDTQPSSWDKLSRIHGDNTDVNVLDRLVKTLSAKSGGTIEILRRGFSVAGCGTLQMSQPMPEDQRNKSVSDHYQANRLRVVRQVRYSRDNENAIDLVFYINGLPVATVELKTDFTQSVTAAMTQYRLDRKPKSSSSGRIEPLLSFKRGAVVHFAMSDSEIYMTTKLAGESTFFLPFNKGDDGAAGNPPASEGEYPVNYFWNWILQKDNWLRIFHRFVLMERKEQEDAQDNIRYKETIIFPRFHQFEAVTKMMDAVRVEGPGHQYLIQHSAGSGKTFTIAWSSHELIRMRKPDGAAYFDSVIVVTDRTVLDAQLQEAIRQIEHQQGVVSAIDRESSSLSKSQQLARALLDGTPIIVVTLQTFPYALEVILTETSLRTKNFAVIMDEAHNSQTGSTAGKLRQALALASNEELAKMTPDELLAKLQSVRGLPKNVSHFAFTATPKHSTKMLFGRPLDLSKPPSVDNPPEPFHLYTMQQAIEEGFILDVLRNYASYKMALRLGESFVEENERVDTKYAKRALARWLSLHPTNIGQKVELIVEHFHKHVAPLLNFQAKAMVVTSSRAAAVKYKLAFDRYVEDRGYTGLRSLIAFSGQILGKDISDNSNYYPDDLAFTESNMNADVRGRDLRKVFDTPEYQVMLVANKFQTGFDQPKLVAMYLDKKISGVDAVQTLSRLNRTHAGKDRTFIIDFVNDPKQIVEAFRTYYKNAQITDIQDPNVVYDMKEHLDDMQLYDAEEVRQFGFSITDPQVTHQQLFELTQPATDRFNGRMKMLNDAIEVCEREYLLAQEKEDESGSRKAEARRSEHTRARDELLVYSDGLGKFVRTYEYVAQLVEFGDPVIEAFASFAKLLKKRLKGLRPEQVDLSGLVLSHYRLIPQSVKTEINEKSGPLQPIAGSLREGHDRERAYLQELVKRLNEAFGKEITDKDKVAFAIHISEKLRNNKTVMAQVKNNHREQAMRADLPVAATKAIVEAMSSHTALSKRLLSDEITRDVFLSVIYDILKKDAATDLLKEARENH